MNLYRRNEDPASHTIALVVRTDTSRDISSPSGPAIRLHHCAIGNRFRSHDPLNRDSSHVQESIPGHEHDVRCAFFTLSLGALPCLQPRSFAMRYMHATLRRLTLLAYRRRYQ